MNRTIGDLSTALEKIQNAVKYINTCGLSTVMVHGIIGRSEAEHHTRGHARYNVTFDEVLYDVNAEAGTLSLVVGNLKVVAPKADDGHPATLVHSDVRLRMDAYGPDYTTCTVQRTA